MIKKIFVFLFIIIATVYTADSRAEDIACLKTIGQNAETFIKPFRDIVSNKNPLFMTHEELQDIIDSQKSKFYGLIAGNIITHCMSNISQLNAIADSKTVTIPFEITGGQQVQKYELVVDTSYLFEYLEIPSAILVVNNKTKNPGDSIKKTDMPKDYFFSSACSDHYIRFNLSDDTPVNKAGQSAFAVYGGSDNEYFLDMPVGKSCRAFPGLVLGDFGGWGAAEKIITYRNYQEGRKAMQAFATKLNGTQCGNQGLAVYQVSIDSIPVDKNGKKGWAIAAGITGGAMAYVGITAGITAAGLASTAVTTAVGGGALYSIITATGVPALVSNPVGWIIAGVGVAVAATIAFLPKNLADIDLVVIMSNPEIIR